jgi:hypothetical protein
MDVDRFTEEEEDRGNAMDVLIWILCMGGYAALEQPGRSWYVEQLAMILEVEKLDHWERLRTVLERVMYHAVIQEPLKALWKEADIQVILGSQTNTIV